MYTKLDPVQRTCPSGSDVFTKSLNVSGGAPADDAEATHTRTDTTNTTMTAKRRRRIRTSLPSVRSSKATRLAGPLFCNAALDNRLVQARRKVSSALRLKPWLQRSLPDRTGSRG